MSRVARTKGVVDPLESTGLLATAQVRTEAESEERRSDDDDHEAVSGDGGDVPLPLVRGIEIVVNPERPSAGSGDEMEHERVPQGSKDELQIGPPTATRPSRAGQLGDDEAGQHEHQQRQDGDERGRHSARLSLAVPVLYSTRMSS